MKLKERCPGKNKKGLSGLLFPKKGKKVDLEIYTVGFSGLFINLYLHLV